METNLLKHAQTQIGNILQHQARGLTAIQLANRLRLPSELLNAALEALQNAGCLHIQARGRSQYYLLTDKGNNMNTDTPKTTPQTTAAPPAAEEKLLMAAYSDGRLTLEKNSQKMTLTKAQVNWLVEFTELWRKA